MTSKINPKKWAKLKEGHRDEINDCPKVDINPIT